MLFDGALRFAHQAKAAIESREIEAASNASIKVQNIVNELMSSLDQELIAPELYRNLMSLYSFVHKRMVAANLERNSAAVDEAVEVLTNLRQVWQDAIGQVLAENGGKMPAMPDRPLKVEPSTQNYDAPKAPPSQPLHPSIVGTPRGAPAGPRSVGVGRLTGAQVYANQPSGQAPQAPAQSPTGAAASQKFPLPPNGPAPSHPPSPAAAQPPAAPQPPRPPAPGRPAFQPPAAKAPTPPAPSGPAASGMQRPKINLNKK